MENKTRPCPICHQNDQVIPVLYGMPGIEMIEEEEKGNIKLGGCCISGMEPEFHCKRCNHDFFHSVLESTYIEPGDEDEKGHLLNEENQ